MLISPQRIRWLFLVKALVVPAAWFAMMIWAFVKVPSSQGFFSQHTSLSGSNLSWAWLSALNSALGLYATLSVNIPDFTVRAHIHDKLDSPHDARLFGRDMPRMNERKSP